MRSAALLLLAFAALTALQAQSAVRTVPPRVPRPAVTALPSARAGATPAARRRGVVRNARTNPYGATILVDPQRVMNARPTPAPTKRPDRYRTPRSLPTPETFERYSTSPAP